jgi:hypothetical protein
MIESYEPYLKNELFNNTLFFQIKKNNHKPSSREAFLCELIAGKSVIHIGCVDHLEIVEQKIKEHAWLHGLLLEQASKCIGIDINLTGIELLKSKGIPNVYHHDILSLNVLDEIKNGSWDYILLGEILEHVTEPYAFLKKLHQSYSSYVKTIILTVPNAFRLKNFKNAFSNKEVINSDHFYSFSPYTITKLLVHIGFKVTDLYFEMNGNINNSGPIHKVLLKKFPFLRDSIIVIAHF